MLETFQYAEPISYRSEMVDQNKNNKTKGLASAFFLYGIIIIGLLAYMLMSLKFVTVEFAGEKKTFYTFAVNIKDVLKDAGFKGKIGPVKGAEDVIEGETERFYTLSEDLSTQVKDGMVLRIDQNGIAKVSEERSISPPVHKVWNIFMEPGQEKVLNSGEKGVIKDTWVLHYKNGEKFYKYLLESKRIREPRPMVIASGSYDVASREGSGQGRPIKFVVTAYTHTGYRTAVGAKTRKGIIAVDPRVIPLGARLYVQGYGYGVAADTGGMIKGKRLDVFFNTQEEAVKWGRRSVNVYILGKK